MTKNRFLSKRLACLLTTALIASPIYLIQSKSAYAADFNIADTIVVTKADNNGATAGGAAIAATDAVTMTGAAGTLNGVDADNLITIASLTNTVTNTATTSNGVLTITGNVTAAAATTLTLTTGTTGGLSIGGNIVETTDGVALITLGNNTTLTKSGDDKTVASAIAGTAATRGTLAITGNTTFNDTIGGAAGGGGATIANITVAANKTATFNAAVSSVAATITGTATLGAATTIPTVTVAAGGAATFTSTLASTTSATIANTATATFNGIATTPSLVVTGTANVNAASQAVAVTTLTNTTGVINIGKAIVSGNTVFASTNQTPAGIGTGSIFYPANLTNGQTLTIFSDATDDADGTLVATNVTAASQNNALSTYTAARATQAIVVTATDKSASTTASELGVNTNKASALLQARNAAAAANTAATDTSSIDAIFNVLNARSGQSATADTNFANQVSPQTDTITGSTVAAKAVTSGVQNVISTRLASLRSGDAYSTGVVTGSGMSANSGFIQAFGSTVEQKNKGNEFGYDADTTGFAVGFDGKIDGGAVIGISYARSEADVDGKGTGRAKNDIKTDSVSLYADYATKDGYIEGSITYGKSDNKGSRVINTGGLSNTYTSNSDSEQYSFRLSGGIPQSLGGGAFFTPFAAATISQIKADAYTESSTTANDALRLRVAQDTVDSQVGTVGVKFHQAIKDGKTTFTPEVKLAVNQEFGDDTITTTNTYQGGGTSFKNSTAIEKTSATAGVGLNISSDNVSFNIGYEADVRDKYLGHSAQAKITAKF